MQSINRIMYAGTPGNRSKVKGKRSKVSAEGWSASGRGEESEVGGRRPGR